MLTAARSRPRQGGFTLIEFAVALAVIGLLMAAVLPVAGDWLRSVRVRNVAESIQNGMQIARNEAVRRNRRVSFYLVSATDPKVLDDSCALSGSGSSWVVSLSSPAGSCSDEPSTSVAPMIVDKHAGGDGGDGVSVDAVQADGSAATTITFNGFGQIANADAIRSVDIDFDDCEGCRDLRIEISPTGSVRMCDPNVSTSGDDPRRCTPAEID